MPFAKTLRVLAICLTASLLVPTPQAAANPLNLPDWVKPGSQIVFEVTVAGSAGAAAGYTVLDVVSVTPQGVVFDETILSQNHGQQGLALTKWHPLTVDPITILAGMSYIARPQDLAQIPSGKKITVSRGTWDVNGKPTDAVFRTLIHSSRQNYVDANDPTKTVVRDDERMVIQQAFDANTGVLLNDVSRQYESATVFNDKGEPLNPHTRVALGSTKSFRHARDLSGAPWMNQSWPAWTQTLRGLEYAGAVHVSPPGVPPFAIPFRSRLSVTDRGDGWVRGTITSVQGDAMSGGGVPEESPFFCTVNSLGNLWMSPDALIATANLAANNQGVVDREPVTGTTTYCQREGNNVSIMLQTTNGDQMVSVYDLQSGLVVRKIIKRGPMGQVLDVTLQNRF
ncbi:MAG: hypothetical protein AAF750_06105 [Planctomycetota bacterium]